MFGLQFPCMENMCIEYDHVLIAVLFGKKRGKQAPSSLVEVTKPDLFKDWSYCCPAVASEDPVQAAAIVIRVLAQGFERVMTCLRAKQARQPGLVMSASTT